MPRVKDMKQPITRTKPVPGVKVPPPPPPAQTRPSQHSTAPTSRGGVSAVKTAKPTDSSKPHPPKTVVKPQTPKTVVKTQTPKAYVAKVTATTTDTVSRATAAKQGLSAEMKRQNYERKKALYSKPKPETPPPAQHTVCLHVLCSTPPS